MFYEWCRDTVIPNLYYTKHYNQEDATLRDYQYLSDMVSFRVGQVRLRQARVVPSECSIL